MNANRRSLGLWALCSIAAFAVAGSLGCATVQPGCGCGIGPACGADVGCAVEPGCGCEPACGCGDTCGCDGRSMAGQKWCGGCDGSAKPLINVCTGPCGCGVGCEPGCGCEPSCGCDTGCGDVCCGGEICGCRRGCAVAETVVFGVKSIRDEFRRLLAPLGLCCPCGSCGGCGEFYWSEWHSDPPQCCDPCDDCGNWVGPSATSMRAPYDHEFSPRRIATLPETGNVLR